MTQETQDLKAKIDKVKQQQKTTQSPAVGFGVAMAIMMDMVCCLAVGLGLGLVIQRLFHTSALVIASFGILGGIAGLFSVVQMGLHRGNK